MNTLDKLQKAFPESYRNCNVLLINADCMDVMKLLDDKEFCLACVDPPYGIGAGSISFKNGSSKSEKKYFREKCWDIKPNRSYFDELFRISKNQIVWGGNYFLDYLPSTRCMIFWDKTIHGNSYADGELAWTSFDKNVRYFRENIAQTNSEGRIHPTQKSIKLYEWLLTNYAKKGQKVFDSHGGSMSSVIAAINCGCSIVCCELDSDYFAAGVERVRQHQNQFTLFNDENVIAETKPTTNDIFA